MSKHQSKHQIHKGKEILQYYIHLINQSTSSTVGPDEAPPVAPPGKPCPPGNPPGNPCPPGKPCPPGCPPAA